MIDRLLAILRRILPLGEDSERMQWRSEMRARQIAAEREIDHLHRIRGVHGPIEDAMFPLELGKENRR